MSNLPSPIIAVLSIFLPMFSNPSYKNFTLLFCGHVLCKGRRTVTEILKRLGFKDIKNFSRFHDFFSKAKWSSLQGAQILFLRLVAITPGAILVSIDSTIERRKGPCIKSLGIQRDPVRSTKSRKVLVPGLNWLVCAIHIKLPWSSRSWALPFLSILMPPKIPLSTTRNKHDMHRGKKHKTMTKWSCQVVMLLRRWLGPDKKISITVDSAFATYALANTCIDFGITLVSRMRLDSRTFEFPIESKKRGRKKLVGKRLPTFQQMLQDPLQVWESKEVDWYGEERKTLEFIEGTCLWYGYGIRPVPIKWVLTRHSNNNATATVLFSTDIKMTVDEVIENCISRWSLEVTFEEARRHLGMETQRQWSDNAIDRTTPCILASYSIINLIVLGTRASIPIQKNSWYKKTHTTFSDVLAYLRKSLLEEKYSQIGQNTDLWQLELNKIIDELAAA